ncbi:competence protein ComK [Halalkalibacter alkalisediminis]|uniref:Competence protein ComK n=1 Tax=Halalkalibacter alkalisediminis TaxID=935616 RepID=A0ABV6NJB7_9BACI|nr:competence protein ComK [Halalkalibacter alkalisediminis]
MTKTILTHYEINRDTFVLLPASHIDYYTIVWERDQIYYVKKTLFQIIKEACLEGGAEYDGRRVAVTHKTGIQSKIPIPVNPLEHIYAFPTHSPKLHDCSWIFYHHIKSIHRHPNSQKKSIITFKNDKELPLDLSYHTLEKQLQRTSYCIVRFSHPHTQSSFYM